ncbi:MAG: hypothetical protein EBS20_10355, partial [Actinobacteria bacterium]|nr:hypothetical protein [Actinomycetota bacterium]
VRCVGAPLVAHVRWDPTIARAVDAGLLGVRRPAPRQPPTSGGGATAPAAAVASDVTAAAQRVLTYHGRDDLTVDVLLDGRLLHITLRNNNGDGVGTVSVAAAPP